MAFSCVADAQHGTLWVYWQEAEANGQLTYNSTEFRNYVWKHNTTDLLEFRRAVRNIIDYGVDNRLPKIKEALDFLVPQIPDWNLADRQARLRSLENGDNAGEIQKKRRRQT